MPLFGLPWIGDLPGMLFGEKEPPKPEPTPGEALADSAPVIVGVVVVVAVAAGIVWYLFKRAD